MAAAILDTGPLVAFFDASERRHAWAREQIARLDAPLLTCEAVVAEAMFLLRRDARAPAVLLELFEAGALRAPFRLSDQIQPVRTLLAKYRDRPISLADACLVRMAEIHNQLSILTLDSDFLIYRKHGDKPIAVISPDF